MCLAQGPQRSDAGEARTRGPSVSSKALYHWATALPQTRWKNPSVYKGLVANCSGPQVLNFFMLNSAEHEIYPAHKY